MPVGLGENRRAVPLIGKGAISTGCRVTPTANPTYTAGALLLPDEYTGYRAGDSLLPHAVINHQEQYADGWQHTNTIEGF